MDLCRQSASDIGYKQDEKLNNFIRRLVHLWLFIVDYRVDVLYQEMKISHKLCLREHVWLDVARERFEIGLCNV